MILPKTFSPFISEETLASQTSPLPEITVSYDVSAPVGLTEVVIESRGNNPKCYLLKSVRVGVNDSERVLNITKLDNSIHWTNNTRKNRVNYTTFKIPDGVYLYERATKDYRQVDLKVFRLQKGFVTLVCEDSWQWDCKERIEQYYPEYFGFYAFNYIGNQQWDGSFDDRVRSRYI